MNKNMAISFFETVRAYVKLVRLPISVLALAGCLIGGSLDGFTFDEPLLFLAVFVVFLVMAGGHSFNDYIDVDIDWKAHPDRPIPSGLLSSKQVFWFSMTCFVGAIVFSLIINLLSFFIIVGVLCLVILYELYLKTVALAGNVLISLLSGVSFVFGGIAVGDVANTWIFFVLAFLIMLGREIIKDVEDVDGDRSFRVTLPMKIGIRKSIVVGSVFVFSAIFGTPFPAWLGVLSWWYLLCIIPADVIFLYATFISLKNPSNIVVTARLLRTGSAVGLLGFVLGLVL